MTLGFMRGRRKWFVLAALGVAAILYGRREPTPGPPGTPPYLTVFLIDGLAQSVFEQELATGKLPNIASLVGQGIYVKNGIGAFPSMTGYAYYPFITGHDAVDSGILGLRWFHRDLKHGNFRNYVGRTNVEMNHDFAPTPRTLFEAFASHSLSIQSYANRGVHESKKLGWQFAMAKYQEEYAALHFVAQTPWLGPAFIPDWFGAESQVTDAAIHDLQHTPKIQWITYASPDGRHHVHGFEPTYNALLRHIDSEIGRYRQASQVLGQEAQRIYAIVSDHGVVNVEHNLDLREPLSQLGLRTWRGEATELATDSLADPTSTWNDVDAIVAVNGNTMNWVYLREGGQGWEAKPRAEAFSAAIAELLATDGVEFVASRTREGVAVASSDGTALLKKIDDGYVYDCSAGDPFGYGTTVPNGCDGKARTANEWLSSTFATDFPYAVPRMYDVMQTPHAGELLVTAKAGYDLAAHYELVVKEGNYKGGHGGLRADQLRVPYIVAGGGVRPQTVDTLLAEDVGVLLERLLGLQSQGQHPRVDALAALP